MALRSGAPTTGPANSSPFARLDLRAARVEAGFDRLYVVLEETGEVVALDPRTGQALDLGPLPRSPTYRTLELRRRVVGSRRSAVAWPLGHVRCRNQLAAERVGSVSSLGGCRGPHRGGHDRRTVRAGCPGHLREVNLESGADPLFEEALAKLGSAIEASDGAAETPASDAADAAGHSGAARCARRCCTAGPTHPRPRW